MNDESDPDGPPLATFTGPAGTATVHPGPGNDPNPGFEVWLNGVSLGVYESMGEAMAVAEDVAQNGMNGPEEPEVEPAPGPKI